MPRKLRGKNTPSTTAFSSRQRHRHTFHSMAYWSKNYCVKGLNWRLTCNICSFPIHPSNRTNVRVHIIGLLKPRRLCDKERLWFFTHTVQPSFPCDLRMYRILPYMVFIVYYIRLVISVCATSEKCTNRFYLRSYIRLKHHSIAG